MQGFVEQSVGVDRQSEVRLQEIASAITTWLDIGLMTGRQRVIS
jgi:hypothetical protein